MRNALLRLLHILVRALRPKARSGKPRTILVLQYQMPLGCCVHGTPLYAAIKEQHPEATLIVATHGLGLEVVRHDPHIDHLIATSAPLGSLTSMRAAATQLRRELRHRNLEPDLVLQDASSRAGSFALFALLLRVAPTAGFANAAPLYDRHLAYDPTRSLIDNNLRLAKLAGASTIHREPAVYFSTKDLAAARSLLTTGGPTTAFVLQGSGGQRTSWHDDRYAAVIRHAESRGHRAIYLGTAADAPNIDRIRTLTGSTGESLAGHTSIPELTALLCLCDFLVTIDTGTLHVGRAAGLPMVVLGTSWQKPIEWLPLQSPNVRVLRGDDRAGVPPDYRLDEITVDAVVEAFNALQQTFPPSQQQREQRIARLLSTTRT